MDFGTSNTEQDRDSDSRGIGGDEREPTGGSSVVGFDLSDPVQSFAETVKSLILQPARFFQAMTRRGDFVSPLVFAGICAVVSAIFSGAIALVSGSQGFGSFVGSLILAPAGAAIGLAIGAAILYLLVWLVLGARVPHFESNFRVLSYASVASLVSWLPIVGWILGLYSVYLAVLGVREVYGTTTGKAAIVVLIPVAIALALVLTVVIIAVVTTSLLTR